MSQFSFIQEPQRTMESSNVKLHNDLAGRKRTPMELKFRMEPTCVDETDLKYQPRSDWPHSIDPWWKPIDRLEKPPYSYATLIAHALLSSKDGRLTLSDIYKWISESYPYFQLGEKSWQNSIRHNLSVYRDWFRRVDRRPTISHPGKGGYWQVEAHMEKAFIENLCQVSGHGRLLPNMKVNRSSSNSSNTGENVFSLKEKYANILVMRPEDFKAKKNIRFKKQYNPALRSSHKKGKKKRNSPQDEVLDILDSHSTTTADTAQHKPMVVSQVEEDTCTSYLSEPTIFEPWVYNESMLFSDFTYLLMDNNDTTTTSRTLEHPETKVIDLQSVSMEKNLHFSTTFSVDEFTDPTSKLYIPELESYQINQYIDPSLTINAVDFQANQAEDPYCCLFDMSTPF